MMETGFVALGILSILYYVCLAWYTKKLNSTFAWFWLVFGVLNIALGSLVGWAPLLEYLYSYGLYSGP